MKKENPLKELYQKLRLLDCQQLWEEVALFDRADARERMKRVAVVRAVGVVFSESGTEADKARAREWVRGLLKDPEEKVRRYAMAALPKLGGEQQEERDLLQLLGKSGSDREKRFLGRTLEKIGGEATLKAAGNLGADLRRKLEANVARTQNPGTVRLDRSFAGGTPLRIHLHCRAGLQAILESELLEPVHKDKFRIVESYEDLVVVAPTGPFTLGDIYKIRCFSTLGMLLGHVDGSADAGQEADNLARVIASPLAWKILTAFTEGPIRYRLEFASMGHQGDAVRRVADRVYALRPALLNDSRNAPWQINVHYAGGCRVELTPRLRPDPRFAYRVGDVPAASHPPLAACLARVAGTAKNEIVWDPFCGSGLELIERALRGKVSRLIGTDLSAAALDTARKNLDAAMAKPVSASFVCCDFRQHNLEAGSVTLVISNPPMGKRVPVPNLRGLIHDLFAAASRVLVPGGRLVLVNPVPVAPAPRMGLQLVSRQKVDMGGFDCFLEKYVRR